MVSHLVQIKRIALILTTKASLALFGYPSMVISQNVTCDDTIQWYCEDKRTIDIEFGHKPSPSSSK